MIEVLTNRRKRRTNYDSSHGGKVIETNAPIVAHVNGKQVTPLMVITLQMQSIVINPSKHANLPQSLDIDINFHYLAVGQ